MDDLATWEELSQDPDDAPSAAQVVAERARAARAALLAAAPAPARARRPRACRSCCLVMAWDDDRELFYRGCVHCQAPFGAGIAVTPGEEAWADRMARESIASHDLNCRR